MVISNFTGSFGPDPEPSAQAGRPWRPRPWFHAPMNLAWEEHGQGDPVLCLHGFGMDRKVMTAAMEPVLGLRPGFRRVYADLPGHGESAAGAPDSAAVAAAVAGFIDDQLDGGPGRGGGRVYRGGLPRGPRAAPGGPRPP